MSKENNIQDLLHDVADAIREKKGTTDLINPQEFSSEIASIKTSMWTGHVDVEGLKAIGWDDEDIAYFQEHGVNWMEEDDEYYKVSDDNKSLYGVINKDNIQEYKDRIVWLPKIDFSGKTNFSNQFIGCAAMTGVPTIVVENNSNVYGLFNGCRSLTYLPRVNYEVVTNSQSLFQACQSLTSIIIDLGSSGTLHQTFRDCSSLRKFELTEASAVTNISMAFYNCYTLKILRLNAQHVVNSSAAFSFCNSLQHALISNIKTSIDFPGSPVLSKDSVIYIIENEDATSAITITLHAAAYARLADDPDIVEALSNHPLVTLASA